MRSLGARANGNLFVEYSGQVYEYDQDLNPLATNFVLPSTAISLQDTFILFGNSEGDFGAYSGTVGRVSDAGSAVWDDSWMSSQAVYVNAVTKGSDGLVYSVGLGTGQLPGNPAANSGGPFASKHTADGTRVWLKQYPKTRTDILASWHSCVADEDGNLYAHDLVSLSKIDENGAEVWRIAYPADLVANFGQVRVSADNDSLYVWTRVPNNTVGNPLPTPVLMNISAADGSVRWYRQAEAPRSLVIDAVEDTTWTGSFKVNGETDPRGIDGTAFMVTDAAIYVTGLYSNEYMYGALPPPSTYPLYVAKLDLEGNRIWFQEYEPAPAGNLVSDYVGAIVMDSGGNLVVGYTAYGGGSTSAWLLRVSEEDGSLL